MSLEIRIIKIILAKIYFATFFLASSLFSQTLNFENYTTKDGLITDEIYNLHQDNQGYIWIFSKYGTLKYNGTEFKPVLNNLAMNDKFIYAIYENSKGQKWIANSNARIYSIRNDSAFLIKGIENISNLLRNKVSEISELSADDSLNLYISSKAHSFKLCKKGNYFLPYDLKNNIKADSIRISLISIGNQYIYTYNRHKNDEYVFKNNIERTTYLKIEKNDTLFNLNHKAYTIPFRHFKKLNGNTYFIYSQYIVKINPKNKLKQIDIGSIILNYTISRNNHIWIGTLNGGVIELNENDSIVGHYLDNHTINDVLIDHQNGLWATSDGLGLFHCNKLKDRHFKINEPLGGNKVCILKKTGNELFVVNSKSEIYRFKNDRLDLLHKGSQNTPLYLERINNKVILTDIFNINKFQYNGKDLIKIANIKSEKMYNIISKNSDTLLYFWRKGIALELNGILELKIDYKTKITSSEIFNNTIYLGTNNGIYIQTPKLNKKSTKIKGFLIPIYQKPTQPIFLKTTKNISISKIIKNKDCLWFCTEGKGVYKLERSQLKNYLLNDGFTSNIVNSINFNNKNEVLISTNKGLYLSQFIYSEHDHLKRQILKPSKDSHQVSSFKTEFKPWKRIYDGEAKDALFFEDKIYLNSRNGLVIINYKKTEDEMKVYFNFLSLSANSKPFNQTNTFQLESDQKNLLFKFDIVSFQKNKSIVKYYLKGPSSDSGYVNNATIRFNQLTPGKYVLVAYPFIPAGEKLKKIIYFEVLPSFWQTWNFKLITFIFAFIFVSFCVWILARYTKSKQRYQNKSDQLLVEYKLIALRAQINPHFISNCMSAIQSLIIMHEEKKANYYIAQFGLLVRHILEYSSQSVITLKQELDLIRLYIELELLRFENKFIYDIEIESGINADLIYVPPLILNPIVENAIWHGLLPIQSKKTCHLKINVENKSNYLSLRVDDNGMGRVSSKNNHQRKKKSYGVDITLQRLINLNYLYNCEYAQMHYEDKIDEFNQPNGTIVIINLPIILNPNRNEKN